MESLCLWKILVIFCCTWCAHPQIPYRSSGTFSGFLCFPPNLVRKKEFINFETLHLSENTRCPGFHRLPNNHQGFSSLHSDCVGFRLCIDYRMLNQKIIPDKKPNTPSVGAWMVSTDKNDIPPLNPFGATGTPVSLCIH